ncbi:hypothetical protein B0H13DRAFT_2233915 [Mycena leptocephala]|nr:hypothetical protein B0H13DRAFT_2233915 [Mycena leptocephala]
MDGDDFDFLYADDPDFELDDSLEHVDDEHDCAADLSDDEDTEQHDPIELINVRRAKANLEGTDVLEKVKKVLAAMHDVGLPLPLFLDALSWGDTKCTADQACRYARTSLMVSDELPEILARWHKPPRAAGSKPAGACPPLEEFALKTVCSCIDRGIKLSASLFLSPPEDLSEEQLTSLNFDSFKTEVKSGNPMLWEVLRHAAYSPLQKSRNKHKDPDMVYTRSHRQGRVPKLWAIYLKACGLSALMSHKWTANAFGTISDRAMEKTRQLIHKLPWNITHDNRLDNQSHFISGCAATVWILPALHRTLHCKEMFDFAEQDAFFILRLLLDSPDFKEYSGQGALALDPPKPNSTIGHIMRTVPYEEASYDGTLRCMHEWLRQLHLDTEDEQRRTALERIIKYRHEDYNPYDRMDWMIPVFGWQYLSTSANIGGPRQAFDVLNRKGLISQATKGPFWHNLDEAIKHISEAHFRACWLVVGNVESLAELKALSPTQLRVMARKILREHASREALVKLDQLLDDEQDHTKRQWTMWNADVLPYLQLRDAIKAGDIGRMQDLLPVLLFRFAGGGNSNYTIEVLELLQGLNQEWPPEMKTYITEFCWVMSRTGRENTYLPFDLGQEENICANMDYIKKISPAIPTLRKVQRYMEKQFKTVARGSRHGTPDKEADVAKLTGQYMKSKLHNYCKGRSITQKSPDVVNVGAENLECLDTMTDWWSRRSHPRSMLEDFDTGPANDATAVPSRHVIVFHSDKTHCGG